eukprot:134635-Pleurochrysis_carterae.AAC.1
MLGLLLDRTALLCSEDVIETKQTHGGCRGSGRNGGGCGGCSGGGCGGCNGRSECDGGGGALLRHLASPPARDLVERVLGWRRCGGDARGRWPSEPAVCARAALEPADGDAHPAQLLRLDAQLAQHLLGLAADDRLLGREGRERDGACKVVADAVAHAALAHARRHVLHRTPQLDADAAAAHRRRLHPTRHLCAEVVRKGLHLVPRREADAPASLCADRLPARPRLPRARVAASRHRQQLVGRLGAERAAQLAHLHRQQLRARAHAELLKLVALTRTNTRQGARRHRRQLLHRLGLRQPRLAVGLGARRCEASQQPARPDAD